MAYLVVVPRDRRSACPIAYGLDLFGDRWTLLVLRDLIFLRKRHFQDFLDAGEGIATNVLADRLARLEEAGMLTKERDPEDGKRFVYRPTAKATDTLPIMLEIIAWSGRHDPKTPVSAEFVRRIREERNQVVAETLAKDLK
jgi:DNA-binding HxlR family transcriptional regulator